MLDICIAFAPMRLPPYVLLEIYDWLPVAYPASDENESLMHLVSHVKKIRLIESVHRAYKVRMCVYMRAFTRVTDTTHHEQLITASSAAATTKSTRSKPNDDDDDE